MTKELDWDGYLTRKDWRVIYGGVLAIMLANVTLLYAFGAARFALLIGSWLYAIATYSICWLLQEYGSRVLTHCIRWLHHLRGQRTVSLQSFWSGLE